MNRVSKEGRVTSENANDTVRKIGTIIIKSTTTVHGATNIIPVRALFFCISGVRTARNLRPIFSSSWPLCDVYLSSALH